ncbi:unnamed protein product [Rotaria sp. Silwood2]|nr:unnamed protein product [Rotaria sp. Silwood2]CAF2518551.1 unnamed protein product [Rotaria sp. Silwood2]CAF2810717.1 unnamed protein product [Rotaria sp. Silwood2]CAF2969988.1 unnamed protein product [Rotaria sp. Silwood2]
MHRFYFLFILLFRSIGAFYLQEDSEDYVTEQEPCNAGCKNGGQCFLSSFCICPKGFSGRYCEVSLNEQCGTFPSMTTMEIDCILCICYNGLFICDIQPIGLCHRKLDLFLTRTMRITRALDIIQNRFKNIKSFEPMTKFNVTLDDDIQLVNLNGYRIVLNHSSSSMLSSCFLMLLSLLSIYWLK